MPAAALDPVIREVTRGYALTDCATELLPGCLTHPLPLLPTSASPAAIAAARALAALAPLVPGAVAGRAVPVGTPRRFFELTLRPDVTDAQVS